MSAAPKRLPLARPKRLEPRPPVDALPPDSAPPTERVPAPEAKAARRHPVKVLPKLSPAALSFGRMTYPPDPEQALPASREECRGGPRPCPLISCSAHLKYDVHPDTGAIWDNHPGVEVEDMAETCSLDLADRGPMSHEQIGAALGTTKQRASQIEEAAKAKLIAQADRIRDLFDGCVDFEIRLGGDE